MFKWLVSWIFSSGNTDVSIPSSRVVHQKPWWEEDSREIDDEVHIPGWKITPDEGAALKHIMGESYSGPKNEITQEHLQISRISVDLERSATESAATQLGPTPFTDDAPFDYKPDEGVVEGATTSQRFDGEKNILLSDLTGMERTALHQLMGTGYFSTTNTLSTAQLSVLRAFSGFDWGSSERDYWKAEFEGRDGWNVRVSQATTSVEIPSGDPPTGAATSSKVGNVVTGWFDRDPDYLWEEEQDEYYYSGDDGYDDEGEETAEQTSTGEGDSDWIGLNDEQQRVFDYIEKTSANLFVTGRAGSGKSFLLRYVAEFSSKKSIVVAPTGVAALNAQGSTIHSTFRLPWGFLNGKSIDAAYSNLKSAQATVLRHLDLLIVDEVSMVPADMLLAIDQLLRRVRETDAPFGGAQVVLFGDPFQLEPVVTEKSLREYYVDVWGSPYFFSSPAWKAGRFEKIELTTSHRQKDSDFLEALDSLRRGTARFSHLELLNDRHHQDSNIPITGTIRLSSTNRAVNQFNLDRLNEIPSPTRTYIGQFSGDFDKDLKRNLAPDILELKVGAQVMMLANDPSKRWMNGSTAEISELDDDEVWIEIDNSIHSVGRHLWKQLRHKYNRMEATIEQEVAGSFSQFPMTLGWARTIHKSQGQSYDSCAVDLLEGIFASGQSYVALSRCRSLHGLYLNRPLEMSDIRVSSDVNRFMTDLTPPSELPPF